jgi:Carbohydrate binding module (family 35)/K319L-like, PKD domain
MLTRNIRYMCLFMVLLTVSLCQICPAVAVKFEAEDAYNAGDVHEFDTDVAGYSGTGHMLMLGTSTDGLDFSVFAKNEGDYPLTIRYHDPFGDKITEIWVNSTLIGEVSFTGYTATWTDKVYVDDIHLEEGDNIVRLENGWTYIYFDYISIGGFPNTATDPDPEDHETVSTSLTQLCWINPDPGAGDSITSDVYFGTTEPNELLPNYGLTKIETGISATCADIPAGSLPLDGFTTYYWVVNSWDSGGDPAFTEGYFWDFNTNNATPVADAGPDLYVGFDNDGDPNSATATLDASLSTDDGLPSATLNYLWEQVSGPAGVIIYPYDTETTDVNLSAVGTYEFRLTLDDTDLDDTDTVLINVYESRCEALQEDPEGVTLKLGDISEDCYVGEEDIWVMLWYWLDCNAADCD